MKGLIIKDFCLVKGYCKYYILLMAAFSLFSLFSEQSYWTIFPCIYAGLIPMTLQAYDEREHWTAFSGALPYTKAQLVSAKYIDGLIYGGVTFAVNMILQLIKALASGNAEPGRLTGILCFSFAAMLLPVAVMLPFVFRFGTEKGRIMSIMVIALVIGVTSAASFAPDAGVVTSEGAGTAVGAVLALLPVISAVIYAASWLLSIKLYNKREI